MYQNDYVGSLLKRLLLSFINGSGDTSFLESWPIINIYQIIDGHIMQGSMSRGSYSKCLAGYMNKCFEFKALPAHALRICQAHSCLLADITLFCHPFFHYIVPISLTAEPYKIRDTSDFIICHNASADEKEIILLKSFLKKNESIIFSFPQLD